MNNREQEQTKGNIDLIAEEEMIIVDFLRTRNLEKTNKLSKPVNPKISMYTKYVKRILDIIISVPALIIFAPLNIVFAFLTYIDVGYPILFKQTRVGLNGRKFTMTKFRNMRDVRDSEGKLLPGKQRVTKFGYFMRGHSLDELLNFWNVLKGDMSIIGPRPYPVFFEERMSERHKMRHSVRPGLDCPLMLPNEDDSICLYQKKFENDIWYVENISFLNDIKLMIKLFGRVFRVSNRKVAAASGDYFVGYDDDGHALYKEKAYEIFANEIKDYIKNNGEGIEKVSVN